ncbi:Asp-tRNA(Asn)/Glu-tRNA(Gln) amidotransferase subunit GatB [bacterium]|jgi:aspartyl/glutamyl-tRNA(asn/gln) amidotransferase, B subunit|nr:Asp-tRNA(Asn)/Glu-tRNA(Gln) amidotransferase subunit GatB [bacterium]
MSDYKKTVGIEVHCELKTNSKMFIDSINNYGGVANVNINEIDFALPGTLPTINSYGIELGIKAALALNCKINKKVVFDRKNYFYPDLPKGYQITQARNPIGVDGYVEIEVDGIKKKIGIHDIHLEEDTCKSTHAESKSYLDFNRNGVPLIEIVSESDMNSEKEAMAYLEKLKELLLYTDVSDCKMEEGSMRCDVNVSVSKTEKLGTRTETKNIGSISSVGRAILVEADRQIGELEQGNTIQEETRRFDEKENRTILMRVKETGNDYRYFPEPDIPPYILEDEKIESIKQNMPILPNKRREIYQEAGINPVNINKIIANKEISDYLLKVDGNLVIASNLLLGEIQAYLNKTGKNLLDTKLTYDKFNLLVEKLDKKEISNQVFKEIINTIMETDSDLEELIASKKQKELTLEELEKIVTEVILNNPDSITDYKLGKDRATKFLMGQIMKATKGSASPSQANEILLKKLSEQ